MYDTFDICSGTRMMMVLSETRLHAGIGSCILAQVLPLVGGISISQTLPISYCNVYCLISVFLNVLYRIIVIGTE